MRRVSTLLAILLGLLTLSGPVTACALASIKSDCCPEGGAPCNDGGAGSGLSVDATACCLASPTVAESAAFADARVRAPADQPHEPVSHVSLAWFLTLHTPESVPIPAPRTVPHCARDASLTYLHTLRLRL